MSPPPDSGDFLKTGGALESGLGASAFGAGESSPLIGTLIGNVRITSFIGSGGMGEVFLGIDERLDRKIAVKTLQPGYHLGDTASERIRREARILSRLDHPSICRLYDFLYIENEPFLLLEYLEGKGLNTLPGKLPEKQVLDIGIQIARGLAAAHREGIIHRDLKPENIIMMDGGKVKILDFGIGHFLEEMQPTKSPENEESNPLRESGDTPTMRGALIGTPRYMSPEQARGEALTPATDLYSLGVLLYELLEGRSPYPTTKIPDILHEIQETQLPPPASASPALQKLILKLLEKDPFERPTALETADTLKKIRQAPQRRRRHIITATLSGIVVLAVIGALIGGKILGEGRYRCRGFETYLEGVWDPPTRTALEQTYQDAGLENHWALLDHALSDYATRWIRARRRACEATWKSREQTPQLLELENACLDRRLQSMKALVSVLRENPADTVDRAAQAAHALPTMESCFDIQSLLSKVPLPEEAVLRKKVHTLQAAISHARALYDTGKYPEGMEALQSLEPEIRMASYEPLSAEYEYTRALLEEKLGRSADADQALLKSVLAATAGRDDRRLAQAWVRRVWVEGNRLNEFKRAEESVAFAQAAIEALGGDPEIEGALANHRGVMETIQDHPQAALSFLRKALRLRKQAFGEDHPKVASTLQNLANLYSEFGKQEEALETSLQALEMSRRLLGPTHPSVYVSLFGTSDILYKLGRKDEARKLQDEAVALVETSYPPDHPEVGMLKGNLSVQALHAGEPERALRLATEAVRILRINPGPETLPTANNIYNQVIASKHLKDWDGVIRYSREALPIYLKLLGEEDRWYLKLEFSLGLALTEKRKTAEARRVLRRALQVIEKEPDTSRLRCLIRFQLAKVETDRGEALRQARLAIEDCSHLEDPDQELIQEIRDWIHRRRNTDE